MTLVPSTKKAPSLPSGKDIATLQREVALLEGQKETLRRQCNFFDALKKQKVKALKQLEAGDKAQIVEHNEEYLKIVEQYDQLWEWLLQGEEDVKLVKAELTELETKKKNTTQELSDVETRLESRKSELEKSLSSLSTEKAEAIRERDAARSEKVKMEQEVEKLREEKKIHEEQMEAEREVIAKEKESIAQQVKDLAIKHGRLQRVAAKYGVKGV